MHKPLHHHLHDLAGKVLGPEWRVIELLLQHWPEVVGEDLAAHSVPSGVQAIPRPIGRDEAKLFVRIPGALAPQFQMQEHLMKERINALIGYAFISQIVFEHRVGIGGRAQGTGDKKER